MVRCAIWCHLYNLKNVENTHAGVLILVKLQVEACNFTLLKLPLLHWVFFMFFKLYKWYQIAQRITNSKWEDLLYLFENLPFAFFLKFNFSSNQRSHGNFKICLVKTLELRRKKKKLAMFLNSCTSLTPPPMPALEAINPPPASAIEHIKKPREKGIINFNESYLAVY